MNSSQNHNPDEPQTKLPPAQPLPPGTDLQFVMPPTDSLGLPADRAAPSKPVYGEQKRPSAAACIGALVFILLVIAGVVLMTLAGT